MNIWIIDHYSSEPKHGGISRQFDFAQGLAKVGHKVLVISSSFSHFTHSYIADGAISFASINENACYAYVKTLAYTKNRGLKRLLNSLSFVRNVIKSKHKIANHFGVPDVVVGCSIHPFTWIAGYNVARDFKARFFAEVRDLWPATQIYNHGMSPYHPKAFFFGKLEKWAYTKAEKIIYSMSRGDKYISGILGFPKEKIIWIDQPMDCERFDLNANRYDELPEDIRKFISDGFVCVFTGYYMDYEGVNEMLKAAEILKNKGLPIKFVFVGSGKEEAKMRAYQEEKNLTNVYIGGRINKELVPALLRRAQVCLAHLAVRGNPKSYMFDASKNKITEYMYSDSCVIYGTYVENQFVKTSGAGYTITPYSETEFAETIERVYHMSVEERAEFGKKAREYVLENCTLEKLTEKYCSILEG